jgi:hypothetical protein
VARCIVSYLDTVGFCHTVEVEADSRADSTSNYFPAPPDAPLASPCYGLYRYIGLSGETLQGRVQGPTATVTFSSARIESLPWVSLACSPSMCLGAASLNQVIT